MADWALTANFYPIPVRPTGPMLRHYIMSKKKKSSYIYIKLKEGLPSFGTYTYAYNHWQTLNVLIHRHVHSSPQEKTQTSTHKTNSFKVALKTELVCQQIM